MRRGVPRRTAVLLVVAALLAGILLTLVFHSRYMLLEEREIAVSLTVEPGVMGITTETDSLKMGSIPPGGSSTRRMTITPAHDARLLIAIEGEVAGLVSAEPWEQRVQAGLPVEVAFRAHPGMETPLGDYEGTAIFRFYRR